MAESVCAKNSSSVMEEEVDILKCEDDSLVDVDGDTPASSELPPIPTRGVGRPKRSAQAAVASAMAKSNMEDKDVSPPMWRKRTRSSLNKDSELAAEEEVEERESAVFGELRHVLSSSARRWCFYEFFKSAADEAYLATDDFASCLKEYSLHDIDALARVEWSHIRTLLGAPRRLSAKFLKEERGKMAFFKDIRGSSAFQAQPRHHTMALPQGQRVTALHPKTSMYHMGSVLHYSEDKHGYMIQFERADLDDSVVSAENVMAHKYLAQDSEGAEADRLVDALEGYIGRCKFGPIPAAREEDVVVLRELVALLERRELWSREMEHLGNVADRAVSGNLDLNPRFQQAYAWLSVEVENINKAIQPLLAHIRVMSGTSTAPSHLSAAPEHSQANGTTNDSPIARALVVNSRRDAMVMVGRTMERMTRGLDKPDDSSLESETTEGSSCYKENVHENIRANAPAAKKSAEPPRKKRRVDSMAAGAGAADAGSDEVESEGDERPAVTLDIVDEMARKMGVTGKSLELVRSLMSILVMTNHAGELLGLNESTNETVFDEGDIEAAFHEQISSLGLKARNRNILESVVGSLKSHLLGYA